ncbi:MAG: hypothetical protein JXJ17_12585 [Anaerolineae bacterium]|nr:hypothetical protein [Anaerolineae bacterium]
MISNRNSRLNRILSTPAAHGLLIALAVAVLSLCAIQPSLNGALPRTDDAILHYYRLIGYDYSIQHGDLWPRYAPAFVFGYGLPLFNYYSPLAMLPMELFHLLGLDFIQAFLTGVVLYTFLGALGAYLLSDAWGGSVAGIVTSAAYAYAPYILLNWTRRGSITEYCALAILPWVLWAFHRLALRGRRRDFLLAVGLLALFILPHNVTALAGAALLGGYCLFLWLISPSRRQSLIRLALALILGIGLATFFWMPALFETDYVHLEAVSPENAAYDVANHFETLDQVFAAPQPVDLSQQDFEVPRPLGWPQLILALLAVGMIIAQKVCRPPLQGGGDRLSIPPSEYSSPLPFLIFALPVTILLIFMVTRPSLWLWRNIPLMDFWQFPWRLIGQASLLIAVLAGLGTALLAEKIPWPAVRAAWVIVVLLSFILSGLPWLYVVYDPVPPVESIADLHAFEQETSWIGTSSQGEYLPIWNQSLPNPAALADRFAEDEVISRIQPASGVTIEAEEWKITAGHILISAEQPTRLVFDWLYFPGWRATVGSSPVEVTPYGPEGLVSFEVPKGAHNVGIAFKSTPLRRVAEIVSLVSLLAAAAVVVGLLIWEPPAGVPSVSSPGYRPVLLAALAAGLLIFAAKLFYFDRTPSPIRQERLIEGTVTGMQTSIHATIGGQIRLLGLDLPQPQIQSGDVLPLRLYWSPLVDPTADYSRLVEIRDVAGQVIAEDLDPIPAGAPASDWRAGFYLVENISLQPPLGTPPGVYSLHVGLYDPAAGRPLDIVDGGGLPVGVSIEVGAVEVTRPDHPLYDDLWPEVSIIEPAGDALILLGIDPLPTALEVGQPFELSACWMEGGSIVPGLRYRLLWLGEGDQVAGKSADNEITTGYDTALWHPGDAWRGVHTIYVPGALESGRYTVALQVLDNGQHVGDPIALGEMDITAPPRIYDRPEMMVESDAIWQNQISLIGCDLPDLSLESGALPLTLYWLPQAQIDQNLKVFVHLVDESGAIISQQDQVPAGNRPTTGWAPGEIVADGYLLPLPADLPPGDYSLRIGWYDPLAGDRPLLSDGAEFLLLPVTLFLD